MNIKNLQEFMKVLLSIMSEKVVDLWPSVNCMSRKPMEKTQSATFGTDF